MKNPLLSVWVLRAALPAMALAASASASGAIPLIVPMERRIELRIESAPLDDVLFQLSYALHPACREDGKGWNDGSSFEIMGRPQGSERLVKSIEQSNAAIKTRFPEAEAGDFVVVANRPGSPSGHAGLKQGDFIVPAKRTEETNQGTPTRESASETAKRLADEREKRYSENPVVTRTVRRNGQTSEIPVRLVRVCAMRLHVFDSQYMYADSDGAMVFLTAPFMKGLDALEAKVVLAHEAAQVALGFSKNRERGKMLAEAVLGSLVTLGENRESGLSPATDQQLIAADRLAMRTLVQMGVEPLAYLVIMKKLTAESGVFSGPTYGRTRPLSAARAADIEKNIELWTGERKLLISAGRPLEAALAVTSRLREVVRERDRTFGVNATAATNVMAADAQPAVSLRVGELDIRGRFIRLPGTNWSLAADTGGPVNNRGQDVAKSYQAYATHIEADAARWSVAFMIWDNNITMPQWSSNACAPASEFHREEFAPSRDFPDCIKIFRRDRHLVGSLDDPLYSQARRWLNARSLKIDGPLYEIFYTRYGRDGFGWVRAFVPTKEFTDEKEAVEWSAQLRASMQGLFDGHEQRASLPSLPRQ
ncbi:hypothetical protein [Caenimonas koreensis]|uniref:hypothetical protein n=1 Tax=Caenimonas koreensis TaxID=367474 RepID=UPI003784A75A